MPKKFRSGPSNPSSNISPNLCLSGRVRFLASYALLAAAAVYVIASLYLIHDMRTDIHHMRTKILVLQQKQWVLDAQQVELGNRLQATSSEFKQELNSEVGLTKQEMAARRTTGAPAEVRRRPAGRHTKPARSGLGRRQR